MQKTLFNIKSKQDASFSAKDISGGSLVPIFQISIVTGDGIEELKLFLSKLTPKFPNKNQFTLLKTSKDKTEMLLDNLLIPKLEVFFLVL